MTVYVLSQGGKILGVFSSKEVAEALAVDVVTPNGKAVEITPFDLESALHVPTPTQPTEPDVPRHVRGVATCPLCQAALTNTTVRTVTVCPGCGRSIAIVGPDAIVATDTHTVPLSKDERDALIVQRKAQRKTALGKVTH